MRKFVMKFISTVFTFSIHPLENVKQKRNETKRTVFICRINVLNQSPVYTFAIDFSDMNGFSDLASHIKCSTNELDKY